MSFAENKYEFLKEITLSNIQKAKANFQLKFNKYHTLYVVDTYDIIEFCFPLIFHTDLLNHPQLNASNYLSYQFFFFEYPHRPIVLDEYKVELYSFWYKLERNISEFSHFDNLKNEMISRYNALSTRADRIAFIESNIGMLLAVSFGALSPTPISRYNKLVTERLQVDTMKTDDESDTLMIEEIFFGTRHSSEIVNDVFDKYCNLKKFYLLKLGDEERAIYLENTYRDIKVYDRIVSINRKLSDAEANGKLNKKYNILYLSSAANKASSIEEFYTDYLPSHEGVTNDSIHRTNLEFYLFQLLNVNDTEVDSIQIGKIFEELEAISTTYSEKADQIEKYKEFFEGSRSVINHGIITGGKDIDDIFLMYHSMKSHRDKINEGIRILKKTGDDIHLLEEFTKLLDMASTKANTEALGYVRNSLDKYQFQMDKKSQIVSSLQYLKDNKAGLKIHGYPGKDAIVSLTQSFPLLLFYQKSNILEIQKLFKQIVNPKSNKSEVLSSLLGNPQILLREFNIYEKNMFFLFIKYLFDTEVTEQDILDQLNRYILLNQKFRSDIALGDASKIDVIFKEDQSLKNDLYYFKTWLLRRMNCHDEAIEIINSLEKTERELDPRLYHSRALCYKNKYYRESSIQGLEILLDCLEKSIDDFTFCESKFKEVERSQGEGSLMVEILSAISNSIIDTYTKLYLLDNEYKSKIPGCRERLVKLKSNIDKTGIEYKLMPAFGHTEIDLEYCESLIALDENDMPKARMKIQEANRRLESIISSRQLDNYESFERSKNNIRKLARLLLVH